MSEVPVGGVVWEHHRRGRQEIVLLFTSTQAETLIIRHIDAKVGAKRIYLPMDMLDDLLELLQVAKQQAPTMRTQQALLDEEVGPCTS